ncbi:MAG: alpha/beta hydrolase [Gammaproteobacteria bacterium]
MKANKIIRGSLVLLGIAALVATGGSVYQVWATAHDMNAHPAPGKMIDVGNLHYHLNCMGTGSPTVILEAGLGENSLSWYPVQADIAKTTRVCAYDRAGLGWSDGANDPMSPEQVARNLQKLLQNAVIEPPFILVGHSRGGLFSRSFYHQFPDEVKGMVLVDSVHDNAAAREFVYARWDYFIQKIQITIALPLSKIGVIRIMGWANADRQPSPLPIEILAAKTAVQNRTATARAVVNEIIVMRKSLDPAIPPPASLGSLPLVVLTSGKCISVELAKQKAMAKNKSVENAVAIAQTEKVLQQELAALSSNSKHVIAEKSGHFIMYDQPDLVINTVTDMVKAVRR